MPTSRAAWNSTYFYIYVLIYPLPDCLLHVSTRPSSVHRSYLINYDRILRAVVAHCLPGTRCARRRWPAPFGVGWWA
eukprot:scaffold259958_cov23-Prasinocladus_malaysianus.AAC.2